MKRFIPRSLVAQIAVVMAVTLLIAQLINFTLILNDRQRLSLAQNEGPAINRFVGIAGQMTGAGTARREELLRQGHWRTRLQSAPYSVIAQRGFPRDNRIEEQTRKAAAETGVDLRDVHAAILTPAGRMNGPAPGMKMTPPRDRQMLVVSAQLQDGSWLNGRMVTPRRDPWLTARLAAATVLLYILVLGTMVFFAARLARPLRDLTAAAERFRGRTDAPYVEPRGPSDLSHAIAAFNGMNQRLSALLQEKDRMLGALSHDLRTPLASLRIRIETMEPEEERQRIVATIEEMTEMLEDTLLLVKAGTARDKARPTDIGALADTVAEEFRELGHEVALRVDGRPVASVSPTPLRRAVRNLVDNAVKYGKSAQISVEETGDFVRIAIADRGPGIAEAHLLAVQEPFFRLEESRNRDTGGTGLGLTIARAIAESHGGELSLSNLEGGGLLASLTVPRATADLATK